MPNVQEPHLHLEIAHVLFMDVVGYSKLLVNEQREIMQQLNQLVRKTAQFQTSEANGKLISIPSGDGMALVFFQSLEEPVQCALEMSRLLKNNPRVRLRMGVHSGTVDQTKGRVAQMGFLSCRAQSRHLLLLVIVKMRDSSTWLGMTEGVNRA